MSQESRPINTFVALYTGDTIASARLVAASSNTDLVQFAVAKMLEDTSDYRQDSISAALTAGRREALDLLKSNGRH